MTLTEPRERLRLLCALLFWAATYSLFMAWNQLSDFPHDPLQMRRLLTTMFGAMLFFGFTRLVDRNPDLPLPARALPLLGAAVSCCAAMVFVRAGIDQLVVPTLGETPSTWSRHLRFAIIWSGYFTGGVFAFLSFAPRYAVAVPEAGHEPLADAPYPESLWVSRGRETVRVAVDAIEWIEAEGDYVRLHTPSGSGLMRATLSSLEDQLDANSFARVHRSAICRRRAVAAMLRKPSGALAVRLESGQEVPVGRSYRDSVAAIVGARSEPRRAVG